VVFNVEFLMEKRIFGLLKLFSPGRVIRLSAFQIIYTDILPLPLQKPELINMSVKIDDSRPLKKMFSVVPPRYDRLNRILTLGADESWRRQAVKQILNNNPAFLDLCCGTGDLVLHVQKRASEQIELKALDFSEPMLELARKKATEKNRGEVEFIYGDAAEMPFPTITSIPLELLLLSATSP
jgi:SAM-dependent methyltransferase